MQNQFTPNTYESSRVVYPKNNYNPFETNCFDLDNDNSTPKLFNIITIFFLIALVISFFYMKIIFQIEKSDSCEIPVEVHANPLIVSILCGLVIIYLNFFIIKYHFLWMLLTNTIVFFILPYLLMLAFDTIDSEKISITQINYKQIVIFLMLILTIFIFRNIDFIYS
jgi:hypothetical protein